jgi:hypothetical protein
MSKENRPDLKAVCRHRSGALTPATDTKRGYFMDA